jgi:hypothetical protein
MGFIHSGGLLGYRTVESIDDVLPALFAAVAKIPESAKSGDIETVRKL